MYSEVPPLSGRVYQIAEGKEWVTLEAYKRFQKQEKHIRP